MCVHIFLKKIQLTQYFQFNRLIYLSYLQDDISGPGMSLCPLLGVGAVILETFDASSSHGEPIDIVDCCHVFAIKAHDIDSLLICTVSKFLTQA